MTRRFAQFCLPQSYIHVEFSRNLITCQIVINPRRELITTWAVFIPFHTHLLKKYKIKMSKMPVYH